MATKPVMGAQVQFCNHKGSFVADIWVIAGANVVVANGPITPDNIDRIATPTHRVGDFPNSGYWRPDRGIFIVPEKQVTKLDRITTAQSRAQDGAEPSAQRPKGAQ